MCGIAGALSDSAEGAAAIASAIALRLAHRGPDDFGVWSDPETGLALSHRRLSVVDLSSCGHQPMLSAAGRYVICFNGEIYNFAELRLELGQSDGTPQWRGHSDTEVLLACFDAWGIEATLARTNGMFALAVWDGQRREITFARDRMGEKPLYFGWAGHHFAFASELSALRQVPGWQARISDSAIASFLGTGYVRGPQSAIEGVFRLPAGSFITLSLADIRQPREWSYLRDRLRQYWSLEQAALSAGHQATCDIPELTDRLEALLSDSVRMRMLSDVPVGAFLSGGIDSSLVVALMQRQSSRPIQTFSLGFFEKGFDEAPHAAGVARHLGTEHHELYVDGNDAASMVPDLADIFDEPFSDQSQIPTLMVSQLARKRVTVALSGDGGDELFAGYGRYFSILRLLRLLERTPAAVSALAPDVLAAAASLMQALPTTAGGRSLSFRLARLGERMRAPDLESLRLSFIAGGGVSRVVARAPQSASHHASHQEVEIGPLRRLMLADQLDYLPDNILTKVDRASMRYALEARTPLLDHRIVEFSWQLPTSALHSGSERKTLLRRVLFKHVPRELVDRPKKGFTPPVGEWLRGPLRDWAEETLSQRNLEQLPMLDAAGVRRLWQDHQQRRTDGSGPLWNVLMLSAWRKKAGAHA